MFRPIVPITLCIPGNTLLLRDPDSFPELPVYPNLTINHSAGVAYLNLDLISIAVLALFVAAIALSLAGALPALNAWCPMVMSVTSPIASSS
ncbi:hypothetical protein DFH09DRAFT_1309389 [Mycena vulgaris]|nr:hypothetical protein DFH09DRAFT_1309389 [Mycena vulgaris]